MVANNPIADRTELPRSIINSTKDTRSSHQLFWTTFLDVEFLHYNSEANKEADKITKKTNSMYQIINVMCENKYYVLYSSCICL